MTSLNAAPSEYEIALAGLKGDHPVKKDYLESVKRLEEHPLYGKDENKNDNNNTKTTMSLAL